MYICIDCNYKTFKKTNYERHLISIKHIITTEQIKNEKIYKCDECDYETNFKQNLNKHKKLKQENIDKLFVCELCNYKTLKQTSFHKHSESNLHKERIQQHKEENCLTLENDKIKYIVANVVNELKSQQNVISNNETDIVKSVLACVEKLADKMSLGNSHNNTNTNCHNTYNVVQILDHYNTNMKDALTIEKFNELLKPIQTGEFLKIGESKKPYKNILGSTYQTKLKEIPKKQRPLACYDSTASGFIVHKDGEGWIIDESNNELINSISETHKSVLECTLKIMNDEEFMNKYGKQVFRTIMKSSVDKEHHNEMINETIYKISNKQDYQTQNPHLNKEEQTV